ncbi:chromatin assembly factor 1 subunit A-A-like [Chiloscyllium plagiosum]|uniref:chromatin assembly factor 1 subunit A-A-like n=1 Tax=Chiloscyllium plagiosum TaxID=36176 RepID=UPI001CB8208F|nr:chromatin assembly factor 1 subunit A-A-like [Chiloscyllium plagiosum]
MVSPYLLHQTNGNILIKLCSVGCSKNGRAKRQQIKQDTTFWHKLGKKSEQKVKQEIENAKIQTMAQEVKKAKKELEEARQREDQLRRQFEEQRRKSEEQSKASSQKGRLRLPNNRKGGLLMVLYSSEFPKSFIWPTTRRVGSTALLG